MLPAVKFRPSLREHIAEPAAVMPCGSRLVALIGNDVEHLLDRPIVDDLALNARHDDTCESAAPERGTRS
jgi:hypothetical protein